jgi:hypothetical protein
LTLPDFLFKCRFYFQRYGFTLGNNSQIEM